MNLPLDDPAPVETPLVFPGGPSWVNIGIWFVEAGWNLFSIFLTIVICFAVSWVLRIVIRRVVARIVSGAKNKANVDDTMALDRSPLAAVRLVQRTRTLGSILQNIVNISIVIVAILLIIQKLNPDVLSSLSLLTAAVGAGLGFGAQNIVKDVLNGMFIVVEDQIGIGDVVDLGLATGIVEYVSVRVTHVRDANGTLWYVRNGEITRIGNMSQGWSRVIVDVSIGRDEDIETVEELVLNTATALSKDPKWRSRIVGKPEMWGLELVTADAALVRVVLRTRSTSRDDVGQELRARVTQAMNSAEMTLVGVASVTLDGADGAFRVRGANPPKTKPHPVIDDVGGHPSWKPRSTKKKNPPEEPQQ